jgi:hypothetical protein
MNNTISTMSTPINNIPIKTKNLEQINDPTIENIFKDFKNNDSDIDIDNTANDNIYNSEKNNQKYEENFQENIDENKIKEKILLEQQIKQNMENKNKSIYNNDFEKEMEKLMDNSDLLDLEENINTNNKNIFNKNNISNFVIIIVIYILIKNIDILKLIEKNVPENILIILQNNKLFINIFITLIILYILYYFEYIKI